MIFGRKKTDDAPERRRPREESVSTLDSGGQFRRNRTLSGVRRPVDEPSERSKAHALATKRRKVGGLLFLILGGSLVLFLLISQFTARVIAVNSTKVVVGSVEPAAYEKAITDYFGLHPAERLRFALNQEALSDYVSSALPEVAEVTQAGSQNLVETRFSLTFREPLAGWQINGRQFYVDQEGIVFERNYYEPPTLRIIDESGATPEQGSAVASTRLLSFVGRVVALAGDRGYTVTEAILPVGTTRQVQIKLKDVQPLIKLSTDRGAGEQVEDMTRSLTFLSDRGIGATYIDVRVAGRAAYQ